MREVSVFSVRQAKMDDKTGSIPSLNIADTRLYKVVISTWQKLPSEIRAVLLNKINISEIPEWDAHTKQMLRNLGIKSSCAKWHQFGRTQPGEVQFAKSDCASLSDEVLVGTFVHELGHAYQTAITPDDIDAIEKAGDQLPISWGFRKEIEALQRQREQDSLSGGGD